MKHLYSFAVALLLLPCVVTAQNSPEDRYIAIYDLIQQADLLNDTPNSGVALSKYKEAQQALRQFQTDYPTWNIKIIKFRLSYLASKINPLEDRPIGETSPGSGATKSAAGPGESDDQIKSLQEQLRRTQTEKSSLEKRIKEVSANPRPASTDTQALAQAQEQINALQRDNDRLNSNLKRQPAGLDLAAMDRAGQILVDAKAKLAEQAKLVSSLTEQNQAMQKRLETVTTTTGSSQIASLQQQLREAEAGRDTLQNQLKEAQSRAAGGSEQLSKALESIKKLQKENSLLRASLEQRPGQTISTTDSFTAEQNRQTLAELNKQIAEQSGQITNLIHEKEALQKRLDSVVNMDVVARELADTKDSLDKLQHRYDLQTKAAIVLMADYKTKIRQQGKASEKMTRQLEDLKKQMAASANNAELVTILRAENEVLKKQVADLKEHPPASEELIAAQAQVASYRARLAILEARAIPYTAEELALLKPGSPALAASDAAKKGPHGLPPGGAELVIEAQRLFAAHKLKEAEDNYQQVLQLDTNNVFTLANLATIQIEIENFAAAETNLRKAMEIDPKDAFTLGVWGNMLYRQAKFDGAFDALSRAAQLDPNSAEIQNMLGITLSHRGQRGAAETALRRALQLDPNYANAHNNLAVIYITQEPPLTELARWHYQKGLALGSARNSDLEKLIEASPVETKK